MPYICLARDDLPGGTIQVLDLAPNTSLAIPSLGQPQTCYVNRVQTDVASVDASGHLVQTKADGLHAYLWDRVEPGGAEQAEGLITSAGPVDGDTLTLGGVAFGCVVNFATGSVTVDPAVPVLIGDSFSIKGINFDAVTPFPYGEITCGTITAGTTFTIDGNILTAVEDLAIGTAQTTSVVDTDTFSVKTVPFTAVDNITTGSITVDPAADVLAGDGFTIKTIGFLAVDTNPYGTIDCGAVVVGDTVTIDATPFTAIETFGVGTAQMTGCAAADNFTVKGITFTAQNGAANPALQQFDDEAASGSAIATATSLALTINDPASQALISAALPALAICSAATGGTDTVTVTASVPGTPGEFLLTENTASVRIVISGAAMVAPAIVAAAGDFGSALQFDGVTDLVATSLADAIDAGGLALNACVVVASQVQVEGNVAGLVGILAWSTTSGVVTLAPLTEMGMALPVYANVPHEFYAQDSVLTVEEVAESIALSMADASIAIAMDLVVPLGDHIQNIARTGRVVDFESDDVGLVDKFALTETTGGIRLAISGATMDLVLADSSAQEFDGLANAGSDIVSATTLAATINHANSQAAISAVVPNLIVCAAANGGTDTVTLTASDPGTQGEFALAQTGGTITLSGAAMAHTPPNPAAQEFGSSAEYAGVVVNISTALKAAIDDPALNLNCVVNGAVLEVTGTVVGVAGEYDWSTSAALELVLDPLAGIRTALPDYTANPHQFLSSAAVAAGAPALVAASIAACMADTSVATAMDLLAPLGAHVDTITPVGGVVSFASTIRGLLGQFALTESTATVRLTVSGANMDLVLADPAAQEFDGLLGVASNADVALTLTDAINDAASIVLVRAANTNVYADATANVATVELLAMFDPGGAPVVQYGPDGSLTLASSSATRLALNTGTVTDRMYRTNENWNGTTMTNTVTALLARLDAGSSMTLSDINTLLTAQAGTSLIAGGTSSTGTVDDILNILAGRGYRISKMSSASTFNQFTTVANPTYEWEATQRGGFTENVLVYGDTMLHGEVVSSTLGGTTVAREITPIRHTIDTDAFKISVASGQLAVFGSVSGMPPVTLWPDSDTRPFYPWLHQGTLQYPAVTNARVLTVYDDSGNVLA